MLLNKKQGIGILSEMIVDYLNKKLHPNWTVSSLYKKEADVYIIEFHLKRGEIEKEILFKLSFGISGERTFHLNSVFQKFFPETAENILNLFNALNFNMRNLMP